MTECFVDGTGLVAKGNDLGADASEEKKEKYKKAKTIDEYLLHMEQIVDDFDFEALLAQK